MHARTTALGEVGVGLIGSGQALLYNSAGLAFMERREAYFTYVDWARDIEKHSVGISTNVLGKGAFGLYAERRRFIFDDPFNDRSSSSADYAIFGGYGQKITDRIAVGTTFKLIHDSYQNRFAFDLGAYAIGFRNMVMAVSLENVSSNSTLQKDARLGLLIDMFALINARPLPHQLDVMLDMEIPINFDRDAILNAAIEYGYTHYVVNYSFGFSLRLGGFSRGLGDQDYIFGGPAKWGGGLHFLTQKGMGVKIDYTPYFFPSQYENGHIISIAFMF